MLKYPLALFVTGTSHSFCFIPVQYLIETITCTLHIYQVKCWVKYSRWQVQYLGSAISGKCNIWLVHYLANKVPGKYSTWQVQYLASAIPGKCNTWQVQYLATAFCTRGLGATASTGSQGNSRVHHCRQCGRGVCGSCSATRWVNGTQESHPPGLKRSGESTFTTFSGLNTSETLNIRSNI